MVFPYTVSKAWYSLINLLKRYSLTFINRTRHDKVVETGVMGGYKKIDLPKSGKGRYVKSENNIWQFKILDYLC